MAFFSELKRRNVFRVAAAYLVGGWLLIEVSSTLEETLRLPEWADSLLAMFLLVGFPVALFFSWAYEITPDGIRREAEISADSASRALTARRLDWAVITMVVIALALMVMDRLLPGSERPADQASTTSTAGPAAVTEADGAPRVDPLSIAVLPFVNMSSDPEQEYFSDGLTEELLNLLAGIAELKVAARTSSFYYKDRLGDVPLQDIARQLEVAHVLEGSVRKGGDRIRITAQLIKADDGFHLWSATWDRTLDDVFAIQDEIAAAVVDELKVALLGEVPHARVIDPRSLELSMRGRFLFNRRDPGDLEQALALFEEAIAIDPDNVTAWVGVTPLYTWLRDPPEHEKSLVAARKAVELDPDNAAAHVRLMQQYTAIGDTEAGWREAARAWELGQEDALALSVFAGYFLGHGDVDRAIELQRRAVAADPLNLVNLGNLCSYLMEVGRLDEAEVVLAKIRELAPDSESHQESLAMIHILRGRYEAALAIVNALPDVAHQAQNDPAPKLRMLAMLHHAMGNAAESDTALQEYCEEYAEVALFQLALLYAWRGENENALETLWKLAESNPWEMYLGIANESPILAELRKDPDWPALMKKFSDAREPFYRPDLFD